MSAVGCVYFIRCRHFVKVGYAMDTAKRLAELQIGNPFPLELIAWIEGPPELERAFHRVLRGWHERGEWFRLHKKVWSLIEAIQAGARPSTYKEIQYLLDLQREMAKARAIMRRENRSQETLQELFWVELDDLNRTGGKLS